MKKRPDAGGECLAQWSGFCSFAVMHRARIAIFASGNGTNAEAIITYFQGHPTISIAAIFCNNPGAYVLERARHHHIPAVVFNRQDFYETTSVIDSLKKLDISHIVLAGFLWLLPRALVEAFPARIINIHPALLPKFGGKGMYGMRVHQAVKASGDPVTGITIHVVTTNYDEGPPIFSATCEVGPDDSPEEIAGKVHQLEHEHYPRIIEKWINNS